MMYKLYNVELLGIDGEIKTVSNVIGYNDITNNIFCLTFSDGKTIFYNNMKITRIAIA